ncbi:MAG: shikimate dehydrogenase [Alteromonadaceae bacterium]|nr:shikimate dehydrogenase [Alteromonadaceae bacterium]
MDQYRVYGNPIKQSRSPFIHTAFAKSTNQELCYLSELVPLDTFAQTIRQFVLEGGKGANITVPFKEQALALCDQLSERARLAGAVNTLSFRNGNIIGDNTDGLGLVKDLLQNKVDIEEANILLLGAGGAAKGVILPLLEQAPSLIVIANRTVSKAQSLCRQFNSEKLSACGFEQIDKIHYDIVINATSASLSGSVPPIAERLIHSDTVCYDMVYGQGLTPFLEWAKQLGSKKLIDGLGMLVGQAAESFNLWRGVMPETEQVLQNLRTSLENNN